MDMEKRYCFACGREVKGKSYFVDTEDSQKDVIVGPDCYKHVIKAGSYGYKPPYGGPALIPVGTIYTGGPNR